MNTQNYDIIIVGTGAAGLFAALCLPDYLHILLITKDALENSDSYLAQGGISALKSPEDYEPYFEDTMRAGRYENRKESVAIMIQESQSIIQDLIDLGVEFEKDKDGHILFTREGAHSTFRILYHKDETGKEITSILIRNITACSHISIMEYTTMTDLLTENNECHGITAVLSDGTPIAFYSKYVILATGGLGGLFRHSTNFRHITGDSFALALKHNIELENIHYIQIHPTTLYSKKEGRRFLISESVRGEGAVLLNPDRKRFVDELLPRDVVTTAIHKEMKKFHTDHVYLSLTNMPKIDIQDRFPHIYEICQNEGYDMSTDLIPVTPAQHYLMGGIRTDTNGETSMRNLYAIGETACNGVHGANRLASNSLLESLVFAKRASAFIANRFSDTPICTPPLPDTTIIDLGKQAAENKQLIINEIKRKDEEFYVKWCNNEN